VLPPDAETLSSLHDEVLRLGRLIGDLETLAAADAATLNLAVAPLDLADVARSVADLAEPAAIDAELTLERDLGPAPVTGDQRRLVQVATNLVANALRYTPAGGHVTIRTGTDGGAAFLDVADTGPGIRAEDLPHLFERFYRGAAASGTTGSGVGLAVASELVEAHQGMLTASNGPERGAVFRVVLPPRS
jgi:two-component system, OmpR family, sensor histidine kinase BaeS